ncbi:hypothetical protein Msil_1393 [Methylocella silvestris BL2]|uniref:Uncharacterized protein n=1 Tax=Methylocella silvestris (strain DSM 15510 / CIP 108128 / LMG 27833 / NCIMB 13906 / BL2) TaxID=395965 RepID=B8ESM3_METSB|nr:hypothetical protein [Methylocella silvestris]ACK50358.1 hypothetical protein Msil_1393 [Methylocella silvestris BL2]
MALFTFEISYEDGPSAVTVEELPNQKAAWCYVEFLASQLKTRSGARIWVTNSKGEVIIHAGAATALASIDWCHDATCPLKPRNKGR